MQLLRNFRKIEHLSELTQNRIWPFQNFSNPFVNGLNSRPLSTKITNFIFWSVQNNDVIKTKKFKDRTQINFFVRSEIFDPIYFFRSRQNKLFDDIMGIFYYIQIKSKKALRYEKLLGFASSPFFDTWLSKSLVRHHTTPFLLFEILTVENFFKNFQSFLNKTFDSRTTK